MNIREKQKIIKLGTENILYVETTKKNTIFSLILCNRVPNIIFKAH